MKKGYRGGTRRAEAGSTWELIQVGRWRETGVKECPFISHFLLHVFIFKTT